jgi:RND superfamily putative drug exporter
MAFADMRSAVNRDYSVVFPAAALLILIILVILLRSVIAPLHLLVGVWLGFGATLGASVITFQGVMGDAGTMFMMPMICYVFVVAVGSDYNILLTTRLREEIMEGASPHDAAAMAVQHAGPTVAAAGLILAGTFGSMMLSGVSLLSQMGFSVMVGILLVAIIMASILIPSVATVLGRRIWWPGHQLDRSLPKGTVEPVDETIDAPVETGIPAEEPAV